MITQARPPAPESTARETVTAGVDVVIDRLASSGYRIDREKWERLAPARLLPAHVDGKEAERHAIARTRKILEVETKLAPTGDLDALCFASAAAGIEDVSHPPIVRHVSTALRGLFALGDQVRESVRWEQRFVGPDGEWRLARLMAKSLLRSYGTDARAELGALESLLGAAFVAYVRSTYANPRPIRRLHVSSTLVNLAAEEEEAGTGAGFGQGGPPLLPIADRNGLIAWISELSDAEPLVRSVRGSAALVRLHAPTFPELAAPWRDCAARCGPSGLPALRALLLVPPVLAAAYLQAGHAPEAADLDTALENLMHFWGSVSYQTVRFGLSTRSFPWVSRDAAAGAAGQTGQ
jgi:hypothetical protein